MRSRVADAASILVKRVWWVARRTRATALIPATATIGGLAYWRSDITVDLPFGRFDTPFWLLAIMVAALLATAVLATRPCETEFQTLRRDWRWEAALVGLAAVTAMMPMAAFLGTQLLGDMMFWTSLMFAAALGSVVVVGHFAWVPVSIVCFLVVSWYTAIDSDPHSADSVGRWWVVGLLCVGLSAVLVWRRAAVYRA